MQKRGKIKIGIIILISLILILIILTSTNVTAGWLDWFKKTITGRAATQPTNISVAIAGKNPIRIYVWNGTLVGGSGDGIDPSIGTTTIVEFNVTIMDPDGAADINTSSVWVNVTSPVGEEARFNSSCAERTGEDNATAKNFSCLVTMYYWDKNGAWNINVTANDLGNKSYITNRSQNFTYKELKAIEIGPLALSWPSVNLGDTNKTSDNDPTQINNSGNYNGSGKINISAINLYGQTTTTEYLSAANFTVNIYTGGAACTGDECVECASNATPTNGTRLKNQTASTDWVTPPSVLLDRGNLSIGQANDSLFWCIVQVPTTGISSQTYSTAWSAASGSWTIKLE